MLLFWIAKVGTTCFGEAFSGFVFFNDASWITRDRAIAAGAVLILITYGIQIATKKYTPISLWSGMVLIAIIAAVVVLYYRRGPVVQASTETVSVAAE